MEFLKFFEADNLQQTILQIGREQNALVQTASSWCLDLAAMLQVPDTNRWITRRYPRRQAIQSAHEKLESESLVRHMDKRAYLNLQARECNKE